MKTLKRLVLVALVVSLLSGTLFASIAGASPQFGRYTIFDYLRVLSDLDILGTLGVDGASIFSGSVTADGAVTTNGALTANGAVNLPAASIDSTEIANIQRAINIPLKEFLECTTNAGALLAVTDGTDTHPHLANSATDGLGFVIEFDDTGGSVDSDYVCSQLMVPPDYVSGGLFRVRATKDAETGANNEGLNCKGSINGAALGAVGVTLVTTSTSTAYDCSPTLTNLAAGNSLGFTFYITSTGTRDDKVNLQAVEFVYTASQ